MYNITDDNEAAGGGPISNAIPVKAIKRRKTSSNKTKPFNVSCRTHGILEEKTTTTTSSTRWFFELVGPCPDGIGESRGLGNG